MIKLLLHESKSRVGSPSVFITLGTYFIYFSCKETIILHQDFHMNMKYDLSRMLAHKFGAKF